MPDTILLQEAPPPQLHPHRFTLGEFFDVYNTTLHKTGLRYELLDGGIYEMPADGPRTIRWNGEIARWLITSLGREYVVIPDKTLEAAEHWGPSPDFYVSIRRSARKRFAGCTCCSPSKYQTARLPRICI